MNERLSLLLPSNLLEEESKQQRRVSFKDSVILKSLIISNRSLRSSTKPTLLRRSQVKRNFNLLLRSSLREIWVRASTTMRECSRYNNSLSNRDKACSSLTIRGTLASGCCKTARGSLSGFPIATMKHSEYHSLSQIQASRLQETPYLRVFSIENLSNKINKLLKYSILCLSL